MGGEGRKDPEPPDVFVIIPPYFFTILPCPLAFSGSVWYNIPRNPGDGAVNAHLTGGSRRVSDSLYGGNDHEVLSELPLVL